MCVSTIAQGQNQNSKNLISNPGAEEIHDNMPIEWEQTGMIEGAIIKVDKTCYDGKYSLLM